MERKNNTFKHVVACALVFSIFVCIFGAIGAALLIASIYWAFEVFFSVGWWAALLIIFGVLVIYVTALSFALELLRGDND